MRYFILFVVFLIIEPGLASAEGSDDVEGVRAWTALTGGSVTGRLTGVENEDLVLESVSGKKLRIQYTKVSLRDRILLQDAKKIPVAKWLRTWESKDGQTVLAELVKVEPPMAKLSTGAKIISIRFDKLCDADRVLLDVFKEEDLARIKQEREERIAKALDLPFGRLERGKLQLFKVPLDKDMMDYLAKEKVPEIKECDMALALPEDFDPAQTNFLTIINVSGDGTGREVDEANAYWETGIKKGYVVLAASGPDKATYGKFTFHWMALNALRKSWPSFPWPIVMAGFSGGAKGAGGLAPYLSANDYNVMGIFMAGCNEDYVSRSMEAAKPKKSAFLKTPIFISNGNSDDIAPPSSGETVAQSLKTTGFRNIRTEVYDGSHQLSQEQWGMALDWFREMRTSPDTKKKKP